MKLNYELSASQRANLQAACVAILDWSEAVTTKASKLAEMEEQAQRNASELAALEKRADAMDRRAIAELPAAMDYSERYGALLAREQATPPPAYDRARLQALTREICLPLVAVLHSQAADALEPFCHTREQALSFARMDLPALESLFFILHEKSDLGAQGYLDLFERALNGDDVWSFSKVDPRAAALVSAPARRGKATERQLTKQEFLDALPLIGSRERLFDNALEASRRGGSLLTSSYVPAPGEFSA